MIFYNLSHCKMVKNECKDYIHYCMLFESFLIKKKMTDATKIRLHI